jgi:hypothetical protein
MSSHRKCGVNRAEARVVKDCMHESIFQISMSKGAKSNISQSVNHICSGDDFKKIRRERKICVHLHV